MLYQSSGNGNCVQSLITGKVQFLMDPASTYSPTPPQCSTIGRSGLNRRVRDGNVSPERSSPETLLFGNSTAKHTIYFVFPLQKEIQSYLLIRIRYDFTPVLSVLIFDGLFLRLGLLQKV